MIRLPHRNLPKNAQNQLNTWQNEINGLKDYAERVDRGKKAFARRNKLTNPTFRKVRQTLTQMCCAARRCGYCEDSVADEVEHIKPKDLYPEAVFVWENYLYACGQCNGGKNNKYAVFSDTTGQVKEVALRRGEPMVEPEQGEPVLIDPRKEEYLMHNLSKDAGGRGCRGAEVQGCRGAGEMRNNFSNPNEPSTKKKV
ncbi:HNH endonuclease [Coleofasciculus sp.]|uniref:HNH endonuclease n=1 Tax=Coleofasciculus sp. TaxID=3100458 RepID=UPI0039F9D345